MLFKISHRVAVLLLVLVLSPSLYAAKKNFVDKMFDAAATTAGAKGVEIAVKQLGRQIFKTGCDPLTNPSETAAFLCDALGSITGQNDEKWEQEVKQSLDNINIKLDDLKVKQDTLQRSVDRVDAKLDFEFQNIGSKATTFAILTTINALWNDYTLLLKSDHARKKTELVDFSNRVEAANLSVKLGELHSAIVEDTDDNQSVLYYPYARYTVVMGDSMRLNFDPMQAYDLAEKKFLKLRMAQQKGALIYLFAAEIRESQCEVDKANCKRPLMSSVFFEDKFEKDMQNQLEKFNAALDRFVLANAKPHSSDPGLQIPEEALDTILRANTFTASLKGADGMWGRIYSMGDQFDGRAGWHCPDLKVVTPVMKYEVAVDDPSNTLDWWTSRGPRDYDDYLDEVHFADHWNVYHYNVPASKAGPCTLYSHNSNSNKLNMPWAEKDTEVVKIGDRYAGSSLGVQRAGGAFALNYGKWHAGSPTAHFHSGGGANQSIKREANTIEPNRRPPYLAMFVEGEGRWTVGDTKVERRNVLYAYGEKKIYSSPENNRQVFLNITQSHDCANACKGHVAEDTLVEYEIHNATNDKGSLRSLTGIYFSPDTNIADVHSDQRRERIKNGIAIDASYSDAADKVVKTFSTAGDKTAGIKLETNRGYHLQYLIDYDLVTYTKGMAAVPFRYRAKLTPRELYLTMPKPKIQ